MKTSLTCPVNKRQRARFENDLMSRVNHEVYFFSDSQAKRKFDEKPWKWCGVVTDPVSHERFRPERKSPRTDWMGRPYFFGSDSTRTVFLADPAPYAFAKPMSALPADSTGTGH